MSFCVGGEKMTTEDEKINKGIIERLKQPKNILLLFIAMVLVAGIGYAGMEKASANPAFCANCHNMQGHYDSWSKGNLLAKKHGDANVNCHDCHEPSFEQQADEGIKYVTGNFEDPLPKREYSKELCFKCHDFEKVKEKTASYGKENPHASEHGGQPECYTCHSVHHQSTNQCAKCHGVSWSDKLDDSWAKDKK